MLNFKITSRAPGRICLFGDHQDYLKLPIIACAINRHITIDAERNDQGIFNIQMNDLNQSFKIPIDKYKPKILKNIRINVFKISKFP